MLSPEAHSDPLTTTFLREAKMAVCFAHAAHMGGWRAGTPLSAAADRHRSRADVRALGGCHGPCSCAHRLVAWGAVASALSEPGAVRPSRCSLSRLQARLLAADGRRRHLPVTAARGGSGGPMQAVPPPAAPLPGGPGEPGPLAVGVIMGFQVGCPRPSPSSTVPLFLASGSWGETSSNTPCPTAQRGLLPPLTRNTLAARPPPRLPAGGRADWRHGDRHPGSAAARGDAGPEPQAAPHQRGAAAAARGAGQPADSGGAGRRAAGGRGAGGGRRGRRRRRHPGGGGPGGAAAAAGGAAGGAGCAGGGAALALSRAPHRRVWGRTAEPGARAAPDRAVHTVGRGAGGAAALALVGQDGRMRLACGQPLPTAFAAVACTACAMPPALQAPCLPGPRPPAPAPAAAARSLCRRAGRARCSPS